MLERNPETAADAAPLARFDALLLGVGAQKAGTTWVTEQLRRHDRAFFWKKEFGYWNAVRPYPRMQELMMGSGVGFVDLVRGRWGRLAERMHPRLARAVRTWRMLASDPLDHADYIAALAAAPPGTRVTGDISPSYALLSRRTFAEIDTLHPNVRYLFLMRDPVERLWSGVNHGARLWKDRSADPGRLVEIGLAEALENPHDPTYRMSRYDITLGELEAAVPRERILCLFYEDLFTEESVARLCAFLGCDPFPAKLGQKINTGAYLASEFPACAEARARAALAPAYDFVRARFGERVPAKWRT